MNATNSYSEDDESRFRKTYSKFFNTVFPEDLPSIKKNMNAENSLLIQYIDCYGGRLNSSINPSNVLILGETHSSTYAPADISKIITGLALAMGYTFDPMRDINLKDVFKKEITDYCYNCVNQCEYYG